jgi:hypothetical protein
LSMIDRRSALAGLLGAAPRAVAAAVPRRARRAQAASTPERQACVPAFGVSSQQTGLVRSFSSCDIDPDDRRRILRKLTRRSRPVTCCCGSR